MTVTEEQRRNLREALDERDENEKKYEAIRRAKEFEEKFVKRPGEGKPKKEENARSRQ